MSTVQLFCAVFLVHVCSALASDFSVQADEKATTCGLDDFQIDTLAKADYWSVPFASEDLDNCFIPNGYKRHHVSSCQLYFSICGSLPEGVCEGHPDTAACQEVVTEDGLRHYYSIGESQESYKFKPNGYPSSDSDGFFTVRHGHTIGHHRSRSCHGSFKISLKFVCDKDRVWDPLSHDAATHVREIVIINHCHLEIEFGYSGACHGQIVAPTLAAPTLAAPTLAPAKNSCSLYPYNLTGLSRYDYWFAEVPNHYCYSDGVDIVRTCNFTFAFCGTLPVQKIRWGCSGAAVCQDGEAENEIVDFHHFSYSMGQFTGFSYNNELTGGGFLMNATNGFRTRNQNCNITTTIVLVCNSSAVWSSQNLTKIFSAKKFSLCEYQFVLPYSGACLPVFPNATIMSSTAHPTMTTPTKINTTTNIHPHPTTTSTKPPPSSSPSRNSTSSHHHGPTNSTSTQHPSSTPTRNSTTTRPMPTSTMPHHNSTATKHPPSSTPTKNSTSSSGHAGTSTASFSPTTAPHVVTTNPTPVDPDKRLILGLTAGVVVFAVLSIVLFVMVIIAVRVFIKKRRKLKFVKLDSQK